jgi:multisubunit Na+/H+ antiporter MnhC subunit
MVLRMASGYRRITISLPPEVDAAIVALANAQGIPQAKIVQDVLIEFAPTLVHLAKLHQQIKEGKKVDAKQTVQHMLGDAMASLLEPEINSKVDRKK